MLHLIRGECLHRRRYLCSFKWWDNHHRDNKSRRVPPSIKTRLCVRDRDSLRRHGSRSASWQRHVSIASCHYRNSQIIVTIHHLTEDNLPQIFLNILYPDPDLDILIFRYYLYLSTLSAMAARWNSFQNTKLCEKRQFYFQVQYTKDVWTNSITDKITWFSVFSVDAAMTKTAVI